MKDTACFSKGSKRPSIWIGIIIEFEVSDFFDRNKILLLYFLAFSTSLNIFLIKWEPYNAFFKRTVLPEPTV